MNKSEFIQNLSAELHCTKVIANQNLNAVLNCIVSAMENNDKLKFVGFGSFKVKKTRPKDIRTPKGIVVKVPAKRQVSFSVGTEFKKAVNKK